MADASFVQSNFSGGLWSLSMQGRFDDPRYRTAMKVCLNGLPGETGAWFRRPGTANCSTTRNGAPGRVISFDFKQAAPYSIELTAGFTRFRNGTTLVKTNDAQAVVSISTDTPAKVATGTHDGWTGSIQVAFDNLGTSNPLLQNRVFAAAITSTTEFTLADAITGEPIDGSTLGAFVSGTVSRIYEFATPYVGTLWQDVRIVQSDRQGTNGSTVEGVFLHPGIKPYVLSVATPPTDAAFATFTFGAANFKDGPYFDPVPGGTLATPSALIGNINITLSFSAYDAARSYAIGDYVTDSSVNYKSLTDANIGNTPASSATDWAPCSAADAISPTGFAGSDIGRHVRLYSEPEEWAVGTTYAKDDVIRYSTPSVYYKAIAATTGDTPDISPTKWSIFPGGAIWTWGKITALTNVIDRALAGSANIGDMSSGGGLAAAFDGVIDQIQAASAEVIGFGYSTGNQGPNTLTAYIGKDYSGASDQAIASGTIYPSTNFGFFNVVSSGSDQANVNPDAVVTVNLRGSASLPANGSDGTLLGTSGNVYGQVTPITVVSTDTTTTWKYVWFEIIATNSVNVGGINFTWTQHLSVAEAQLYSPTGTGTSQGVTVQILGDALLYSTAIRTWRLGLFSNTTGWPSCGTYHEGRLWLSGVVGNRIDGSKSNDIYNMAPTNPDGSVPGNNAIAYAFNAPSVNTIFWMQPDDKGIVCGTEAGEWLVQATTLNAPLTPTTIQAHQVTKNGCANIEPRRTDLTLAIVQRYKRKCLEYFADVYSGKFSAQNLSAFSKHLTKAYIQEIGWQQELAPVLWHRMGDGSLVGITYKRDSAVSSQPPQTMGAHRHALGSGRTVESIAVSANATGTLDALQMVTNDPATGIRHVEMLTPMFDETDDLASAWMLDDAVEPSSTVSSSVAVTGAPYGGLTLNGLWHLNDKSVTVFAGGLDCGDVTVTNGSAFVSYGDGVSGGTGSGLFTADFVALDPLILVGFTYNSDGQIVRPNAPAESGARNGPAFGKIMRTQAYAIKVISTAGLSIGTTFAKRLDPVLFKHNSGPSQGPLQTFTGVYRATVTDNGGYDSSELCWRVSRPFPAIITAIGGFEHAQDV